MRLIVSLAALVAMGSAFPPAERLQENKALASLFYVDTITAQVLNKLPAVNRLSETKVEMRDGIKERQTNPAIKASSIPTSVVSGVSTSRPSDSGFPTLIPGANGFNSTNGTGVSPDGTDTGTKIPVPIIAGVVAGVFVLLVIACLCCIGRKKRWCGKKRTKYAPLPQPGVHVNVSASAAAASSSAAFAQSIPMQQHGPSHNARSPVSKHQFGGTHPGNSRALSKQVQPKIQHPPVYQAPAQLRDQPPSYHGSPSQSTRQQTPKKHTIPFPQTIYSTPPPAPVGPPPRGNFNSMGVWVPEKSTTPRPKNARNG